MTIKEIANCVKRFLDEKEARTLDGKTYNLDETFGLLISHDGGIDLMEVDDDNTIHLIHSDNLRFGKPVSFEESKKSFLEQRIENIVEFYLEGDGKDLGKEGLVWGIKALVKNIMNWDKTPTYENKESNK